MGWVKDEKLWGSLKNPTFREGVTQKTTNSGTCLKLGDFEVCRLRVA